jgi:hypothetical protein
MSNLDGAASNKTQDILRMPSPEGGLDPQIATPTVSISSPPTGFEHILAPNFISSEVGAKKKK